MFFVWINDPVLSSTAMGVFTQLECSVAFLSRFGSALYNKIRFAVELFPIIDPQLETSDSYQTLLG